MPCHTFSSIVVSPFVFGMRFSLGMILMSALCFGISILSNNTQPRKALASLFHLVGWDIWKERNACVFRAKAAPVAVIMRKIKDEVSIWALAGVRHLNNVMMRRIGKKSGRRVEWTDRTTV